MADRPRYCGLVVVAMLVSLAATPLDAQLRRRKAPPVKPATLILPAEVAWESWLPAPPAAAGVLTGTGTVIVPSTTGEVFGIDANTGATLWTKTHGTSAAPVMTGALGSLAVLGSSTEIVAWDARSGEPRWRTPVSHAVRAIAAAPLVVYVVTEALVLALDAESGRTLWTHTLTQPASSLAIGPRAVTIVGDDRVLQLARPDGRVLWTRTFKGTLTPPVWSDTMVIVGSSERAAWGLDGDSGHTAWTWRLGAPATGVAADRTQAYVATLDTLVRAVNRGNGHQRWQRDTGTRPLGAPVALDGAVLVAGLGPALSAFDSRTGAALGTVELAGPAAATPLVGSPLVASPLRPGAVSVVLLRRDGQITGLRSTTLSVRELPPTPLLSLPGRIVPRERLPLSQP